MPKATLNLSPPLARTQAEAEALGVSFPALLTADVVRYRQLASAATPDLTDWQWSLLGHVLDGTEADNILFGIDDLPGVGSIVAAIDEWADGATDEDTIRAGELRRQVLGWSPLAVAGVLLRLRGQP